MQLHDKNFVVMFFFPFQQAIKLRLQVCGDCSDWKPLGGESSAVIRGAET